MEDLADYVVEVDDIKDAIDNLSSSLEKSSDHLHEMNRHIDKQLWLGEDVLGIQEGTKPLVEVIERLIIAVNLSNKLMSQK